MPTVLVSDADGTYNGSTFPATAMVAGIDGNAASSLEGVPLTRHVRVHTVVFAGMVPGVRIGKGKSVLMTISEDSKLGSEKAGGSH